LLAITANQARFEAAEGDFDLLSPSDDELVEAVYETLAGNPTASERRGDASFALRRSLVTL
jgi:hypothetical protein